MLAHIRRNVHTRDVVSGSSRGRFAVIFTTSGPSMGSSGHLGIVVGSSVGRARVVCGSVRVVACDLGMALGLP
eukprot:3376026-Pyramimonas_sp.AAC.1